MAQHEGEEDPAVYRSGPSKSSKRSAPVEASAAISNPTKVEEDSHMETDVGETPGAISDEDMDDVDEDDDDSGTLLTVQPGFNRLLLVLRDEGVMRFVKYVSASAGGSRFDICAEFEVGMVEDDDSEEAKESHAEGEAEE